jgi:hypothetical protein
VTFIAPIAHDLRHFEAFDWFMKNRERLGSARFFSLMKVNLKIMKVRHEGRVKTP